MGFRLSGLACPRAWCVVVLALLFAAAPCSAYAASCADLRDDRAELEGRMASLVANYPGTHIVIGLCAASASSTYDQTKDSDQAATNFATCAGAGCLLVGFDNCVDVASRWFDLGLRNSQIKDRMQEEGCD